MRVAELVLLAAVTRRASRFAKKGSIGPACRLRLQRCAMAEEKTLTDLKEVRLVFWYDRCLRRRKRRPGEPGRALR